jgi:formate hydrogenlyase subunit 3/multisubunit Na+/H+ antiporter MnhD subunit
MIALPVLIPLLFALLALLPGRGGALGLRMLPLASLPALALALLPAEAAAAPWLLLGLRLAPDELGRALLLLIGLAWTAAAWFASDRIVERRGRFALFWCLALAGLCQAALAADLAGFYLGYVAMTLAGYGLVVHVGSGEAFRAGRVYLVMAFLGEAAVLSGLLGLGARFGNADLAALADNLALLPDPLAGALLIAGFAVKMGLVPLHPWLPLAHPVAPVPASAILSGVIVKAGLLGAFRLVPGEAFGGALPLPALLALGLFTAFYGVAAGLGQARPKTILAYSTVSQMGLVFCALALALHDRALASLLPLLLLHHGLNKAALFLAAGSQPLAGRLRMLLLALPALALVGLPATSGALAKAALKSGLASAAAAEAFSLLLSWSSVGTALLMLHLLRRLRAETPAPLALHPAWPLLVAAGIVVPWWIALAAGAAPPRSPGALWDGLWPALLAVGLHAVWLRLGWPRTAVPEGDLLAPLGRLLRHLAALADTLPAPRTPSLPDDLPARLEPAMRRLEAHLSALPIAGLLLLMLVLVLRFALQ